MKRWQKIPGLTIGPHADAGTREAWKTFKHIAEQRCKEGRPAFADTGADPPHQVACHLWDRLSPEGTAAQ